MGVKQISNTLFLHFSPSRASPLVVPVCVLSCIPQCQLLPVPTEAALSFSLPAHHQSLDFTRHTHVAIAENIVKVIHTVGQRARMKWAGVKTGQNVSTHFCTT